jgi:hypothetical protein
MEMNELPAEYLNSAERPDYKIVTIHPFKKQGLLTILLCVFQIQAILIFPGDIW